VAEKAFQRCLGGRKKLSGAASTRIWDFKIIVMKQTGILLMTFAFMAICLVPLKSQSREWPVLKHYDSDHLYNIALPLGGIGTGTVSLGGRGELRDWEIMNKPAKGFSTVTMGNDAPFFAVYVKEAGGVALTRALMGPLDDMEYHHKEGRAVNHHGLPRFSNASFDAAYPFGQVNLSDKTLPVKVRIKGFNPLIPGNADDSGIPIAILTYEVTNLTDQPIEVAISGNMRNFIGADGSKYRIDWKGDRIPEGAKNNRNTYRESGNIKGIFMYSEGVDENDPAWGTIALTTNSDGDITFRRSSVRNNWGRAILDFWDDFSADGELTDKEQPAENDPMASLAVKKILKAGETQSFPVLHHLEFPQPAGLVEGKSGQLLQHPVCRCLGCSTKDHSPHRPAGGENPGFRQCPDAKQLSR
jgi:non-lysosomal glucosylceramidase